ncbi:MAG: SocA family protein [Candidatus Thiodiazotropha sp. (ex Lucinoma borealis)]|nr:SocA family protein [Candidatus Thiodiazotropha sp. (ex Lucinoma borealis)]
MLIEHNKEKLINAIIYFVNNTKFCGKTKLFKLLYFLDFEHFSTTGRSVTGLDYYAWPKGPVPNELYDELDHPSEAISKSMAIGTKVAVNGKEMLDIQPKCHFVPDFFSKRERKLLENLSSEYCNSYAGDMVEATHLENLPWHEIYEVKGLKQSYIPYELALKKAEYEQIIKNVIENDEFKENYK